MDLGIFQSSNSCSGSYAYLYVYLCFSVLVSIGGVYVWHRFIKTKPVPAKIETNRSEFLTSKERASHE